MSDDRRDFLERQEARERRKQQRLGQKPPAGRSSPLAGGGNETARRQPADQPQAAARGKSAPVQPNGQARRTRPPLPQAAERTGSAPAAASAPDDQQDRSPSGGREGRRAAAQREQVAGLTVPSPGLRPSLLARLILWGVLAICGLLVLASIGEALTVYSINQQVAANQQAANQLQAQNQQLANTIRQLQQPSTIEQEARKLGFIFPGDQPVIVVTTTPQPAPTQRAAPPSGWSGFWPDWLKLFFGG